MDWRGTYVFLSKQVLHLLLSCLAEGVSLQGCEAVVYGQVHLSHSGERAGGKGVVRLYARNQEDQIMSFLCAYRVDKLLYTTQWKRSFMLWYVYGGYF